MTKPVTWHWICLDDEDLGFILNFDPERERSANRTDLAQVIEEFQSIIEDGLESA